MGGGWERRRWQSSRREDNQFGDMKRQTMSEGTWEAAADKQKSALITDGLADGAGVSHYSHFFKDETQAFVFFLHLSLESEIISRLF